MSNYKQIMAARNVLAALIDSDAGYKQIMAARNILAALIDSAD